jgi:hypothetical protein
MFVVETIFSPMSRVNQPSRQLMRALLMTLTLLQGQVNFRNRNRYGNYHVIVPVRVVLAVLVSNGVAHHTTVTSDQLSIISFR